MINEQQKMIKILRIRIKILFIIYFTFIFYSQSTLNIQQYPQYQLQTPQVLFDPIQQSNNQMHPSISKLMFITPWNDQGKKLTVKYANRLKYVSPCWYQLIVKDNTIVFENQHLVDKNYIQKLKQNNPNIKIVPRIYVSNFQVFRTLGTDQQTFKRAMFLILATMQKHKYDGIVWDSPYNTFTKDKNVTPLNNLIYQFVHHLKKRFDIFKDRDNIIKPLVLLFNMANPSNRQLDDSLYSTFKLNGLLIQNYDSPLDYIQMLKNSIRWIQKVKPQVEQTIMMLPFFSYKNGQGISTMDVKKQLQQDQIYSSGFQRGMCKFISNKRIKYNVPCFKYFEEVYKILEVQKYSVGFWQGGNGLQNYYLFM